MKVKVRKGLTLFFKKLAPFCEFYINTMASKSYVLEILKIFEKYYDVFIKGENVMFTSPNAKKNNARSRISKKQSSQPNS